MRIQLLVSAFFSAWLPLLAPAAEAQSTSGRVGGGLAFETFRFGDAQQAGMESVTLLTTPFGARIRLGSAVSLDLVGTFASGRLVGTDGSESTLSGLTDTSLFLNSSFGDNSLVVSAILRAPTGTATHDEAESALAGVIAADLLPFQITNWGAGGGAGLQVTGARRFEGVGAGLSVSYRRAGEFEPLSDEAILYQPGDELAIRLAIDTEFGRNGKGSLVVGFQHFGSDAFDGANLFQSGTRFDLTGSYAFPVGLRGAGLMYGTLVHRSNGVFLDGVDPDRPSQDLVLFGGLLRSSLAGGWVTPRFDVRLFRSADGMGQGFVGGVGGSVEIPAGEMTWIPSVTGQFGQITLREGQQTSVLGFEAGLTLRFGR